MVLAKDSTGEAVGDLDPGQPGLRQPQPGRRPQLGHAVRAARHRHERDQRRDLVGHRLRRRPIGIMWSNQAATNTGYYFAVHRTGSRTRLRDATEAARTGAESADDHVSLKADAAGRVYAAMKTSLDRDSDPLTGTPRARPGDGHLGAPRDRTQVRVPQPSARARRRQHQTIRVLQTGPSPPDFACKTSGGTIYEKASPMGSIAFPTGHGTAVIRDADSAAVHDVSSTKQNLSSTTASLRWRSHRDVILLAHVHCAGPRRPPPLRPRPSRPRRPPARRRSR